MISDAVYSPYSYNFAVIMNNKARWLMLERNRISDLRATGRVLVRDDGIDWSIQTSTVIQLEVHHESVVHFNINNTACSCPVLLTILRASFGALRRSQVSYLHNSSQPAQSHRTKDHAAWEWFERRPAQGGPMVASSTFAMFARPISQRP